MTAEGRAQDTQPAGEHDGLLAVRFGKHFKLVFAPDPCLDTLTAACPLLY